MTPAHNVEIEVDVNKVLNEVGNFELTVVTHFKRVWLLRLGLSIMIFGAWIIGVNGDKVKTHLELDEL